LFCLLGYAEDNNEYEEVVEEKTIDIPKGQVVQGNYYSLGDLNIEGKVEGSVYIIGTEIEISGEITKNLTVIGGSVYLRGNIGGNVHIIAGQAIVEGQIQGDVSFIGANLLLPSAGQIKGDLFIIAGNAALEDVVSGYVTAIIASFTITGTIEKNLHAFVDRLRLSPTARILGNLTYRSRNPMIQDPGSEVMGKIKYRHTFLKDLQEIRFFKGVEAGAHFAHLLVKFFYTFIIGIILIYLFPGRLQGAIDILKQCPGKSFMYGLVVLMALPILTGILLITVVGAPFALTLLALNIISFYTVTVFPILWLTNKAFSSFKWKESTVFALIVGQTIYYLLTTIPVFGTLIACLAVVFGFGATIIAQTSKS
jgi:cytoskeletal protein CcmA (bactofilin family)